MFDKKPDDSEHVKNIPYVLLDQMWLPSSKKRQNGSPQLPILSPQVEENIAVVKQLRAKYGRGAIFFGDAYYKDAVAAAKRPEDGVEIGIYAAREAFEAAQRASETQH